MAVSPGPVLANWLLPPLELFVPEAEESDGKPEPAVVEPLVEELVPALVEPEVEDFDVEVVLELFEWFDEPALVLVLPDPELGSVWVVDAV